MLITNELQLLVETWLLERPTGRGVGFPIDRRNTTVHHLVLPIFCNMYELTDKLPTGLQDKTLK